MKNARPEEVGTGAVEMLGRRPHDSATDPLPAVLPWAAALISAAEGPIPEYGSAAWSALPDDSRAKVAACVLAAETLRTWMLPEEHARRLRAELEYEESAETLRILMLEAEPAAWSSDVVADVRACAGRASFAELSQRRGEPEKAVRAREHVARMREVA